MHGGDGIIDYAFDKRTQSSMQGKGLETMRQQHHHYGGTGYKNHMHTGISEPGVASVTPIETLSGMDNAAKSHYSAVYNSNNPVSSGLSSHDDQGQGIPKPI